MKYISFCLLLSTVVCRISSHVDSSDYNEPEGILQQHQLLVEQPRVTDKTEPSLSLDDVPASATDDADAPPATTEHVHSMKTLLTEKDSNENNFWVDPVNLEAPQDPNKPHDEGSLHQISIEDIQKRLYDDEHSLPSAPLNEDDESSLEAEDSTSTPGDTVKIQESTSTDSEEEESTLLYKWPCSPFNLSSHLPSDLPPSSPKVIQLSDDEEMVSDILHRMNESSGCAVVMFYSPYCEFSMRMAPLYNAVGRSYSELAVLSVDAQESMNMAARYGIIGIPTVLLFYSGRAVARFNRSRTPDDVASFIQDFTGFSPTRSPLEVLPADAEGPMPTQLLERTTTHLSVAMAFLMAFAAWHLMGGVAWRAIKKAAVSARDLFVHEKEE